MTKLRQGIAVGALALACAVGGALVWQWSTGAWQGIPDATAKGQAILSASLPGLDGATQSIAQWRGKVLVVNFWATWCDPCREEIPGLIEIQKAYAANGVQMVGIAIDQKPRAESYAHSVGMNYPVLMGGIETMDLASATGNRAGVLPYTLIIDRAGRLVSQSVGILTPEKLRSLIEPLLLSVKS